MPINYSKYPPNWKLEIVPAVIKRANNCCETCGLVNYQIVWSIKIWVREGSRYKLRSFWFRDKRDAEREGGNVQQKKVVLTISHTDHDEENHEVSLDRLKALCQLCHLRYDAKEKLRRIIEKSKRKKMELFTPNLKANQTEIR